MESETFIDTSGFFAALNPRDQQHATASAWFAEAAPTRRLVTTDYVLDETITLLQSRRQSHLVESWLSRVLAAGFCEIVWMNAERFNEVRQFFAKHADKLWSFTDCFSFCVMKERGIRQALASDQHFRQAGFEPLLGD